MERGGGFYKQLGETKGKLAGFEPNKRVAGFFTIVDAGVETRGKSTALTLNLSSR